MKKQEWTIYKYIKKNEQITNIYKRNQRKLQTIHPWYQPTFT